MSMHVDALRRHSWALLLALIVGVLCMAPQWYALYAEPAYTGIHLIGADAEDHYDARVQEVRDGFPAVGNTFLPDKSVPPVMPALGEDIVAYLGQSLGLSTPEFNDVGKFVFPFIVTLLMYTFGYFLLRSRAAALLGTAIVVLGDNLISGPSAWLAFLHGSSAVDSFLTYARPINPEVSGLFFFGALILIVRAFFSERSPRWYEGVFIGILIGMAFYPSPYVCSFTLLVVAFVGVVSIYHRAWDRVIAALTMGVTTGVVLLPFIFNYLTVIKSPLYMGASMRLGAITAHAPVLGVRVIFMLLAALFAIPKRFAQARSFYLYASLSLIIVLNQQVITGHALVSAHYHWYVTKPLVSFLFGMYVVALVDGLFRTRPRVRYVAYALCFTLLIVNAVEVQWVSYRAQRASFTTEQRYVPVMRYLATLPEREFIWTDDLVSEFIPIYTHHDTANNHQVGNYLVPTSYLEDQLFVQYRLSGLPTKDAPSVMQKERAHVSSVLYSIYWREAAGSFAAIPDATLVGIEQRYVALAGTSTLDLMKSMGITMIVWDKKTNPDWHLDTSKMQDVFSAGDIVIYKM